MKTSIMLAVVFGLFAPHSWANWEHGPCKPIYEACKTAGKKGKEIRNCAKAIKEGKTVEGVSVTDADVTACKAEKGKK